MRRLLHSLLCVVGLAPLAVPVPVGAAGTSIVGAGTWDAIVALPLYPCPAGGCAFTFSGEFAGSVTVLDASGTPTYTATWAPGLANNLTGGPISYSESCGTVPVFPDTGSAGGPFSIGGGVMTLGAKVVGTATLQGTVAWSRTTAAALLNTTGVSLLLNGSTVAATSGVGLGAATFGGPVPPPGRLPPSCSNEEPVTVALTGTYMQPN